MRRPRAGGFRGSLAAGLLGGAAFLASSCFSTQPVGTGPDGKSGDNPSLGLLRLSSAVVGQVEINPTACTAGDRQHFLGGDFEDGKAGLVVRLVVDPLEGPAVRVFRPEAQFEKSRVFRRSDCRVFHFSLDTTGWRINHVTDYRLTLELDCASPDGDTLSGQASATHCH